MISIDNSGQAATHEPPIDRVRSGKTRFIGAFTEEYSRLNFLTTEERFKDQFVDIIITLNRKIEVLELDSLNENQLANITILPEFFTLIIDKISKFNKIISIEEQLVRDNMQKWLEILRDIPNKYDLNRQTESKDALTKAILILEKYLGVESVAIVENKPKFTEQQLNIIEDATQFLKEHPDIQFSFPNLNGLVTNIESIHSGDQLLSHLISELAKVVEEAREYLKKSDAKSTGAQNAIMQGVLGRLRGN